MALLEGTTGHPAPRHPIPASIPASISAIREAHDEHDLELIRTVIVQSGPSADDVLEAVVERAAGLLDAPARLAEPVGGRLVWTRAFGVSDIELGSAVDTFDTLTGSVWRSGIVQYKNPGISARCCGDPPSALAVPIVHDREAPGGRHASTSQEIFGLVVLTAAREGWFDRADVRSMLVLASAAADRIAELHAQLETQVTDDRPADPDIEDADDADHPDLRDDHHPELGGPSGDRDDQTGQEDPQADDDHTRGQLDQGPSGQHDHGPRGQHAAHSGELTLIHRPEADAGNVFGGWFAGLESKRDDAPVARPPTTPAPRPPTPGLRAPKAPSWFDTRPQAQAKVPRQAPSRLRRPGQQPASTLPPSMPAPDSMGLWQWDARTGECTWSSPVNKLLGIPADEPLTIAKIKDAVAPDDRERFEAAVKAITSGRGAAGALKLAPRARNEEHRAGDEEQGAEEPRAEEPRSRTAYAWSEVKRDERGVLLGAWGGVVDVTAFEYDAAQLRSGLTAQRAAQELAGLATWQWWPERRKLVWSQEMYRLLGVSADSFAPTLENWHAFVHPDDASRARMLDQEAANPAVTAAERVETFRLIGSGGEIRHVQSWSARSDDGVEPVVYGATIDVTRQVQDRVLLEHLSITDPVTGLGNRLAYDRRINDLLARPAPAVTLMLLDLDRFKVVNDSLGHQVGDRLLIEVARRLVAVVPAESVTARMGGDEFVVLPPPGAPAPDVARLAASIVDALRAPYVLPETGELLVCPVSIGIAMSARRRVTGHDLLREADIALYQAKDGGRDRFVIFDDELAARTQVRARAERRLRDALQDGRLMMEYQPVIDFANGRMAGAEGLVRLYDEDDESRLIPPDLFMDMAEQTGLVVEVDCWVIEAALAQLTQWGEHSPYSGAGDADLPWLAINLSARSMEHPRVVRRLIDATKRGEVGRGRLKIELTEQSFIGSLPGVEAALRQLMAHGIEIGIDDFGTGYSALAYLANFDLDFMKIDRSFVATVGDNPRSDAVVTAIVDLAHAHGMRVIAEGVETSRQARRLREMGCDFAQGYHFGRPGAPSRITPG